MTKVPLDYSQLSDKQIQTELEKGYADIEEGRCAYVDEVFDNIRRRCKLKTEEEQHKEKLRNKFRLEATKRKKAEEEQKMMEELAGFIFQFGEKYDVLLDIKVKPRKAKQKKD